MFKFNLTFSAKFEQSDEYGDIKIPNGFERINSLSEVDLQRIYSIVNVYDIELLDFSNTNTDSNVNPDDEGGYELKNMDDYINIELLSGYCESRLTVYYDVSGQELALKLKLNPPSETTLVYVK